MKGRLSFLFGSSTLLIFILGILFLTQKTVLQSNTEENDIAIPQIPTPTNVPEFDPNPPTFAMIFDNDHRWTATLSAEKIRTVIATGDVIPARNVNNQTTELNNFRWPFEKTADVLKSADVTFINLENPLLSDCPIIRGGFTFCGSTRQVEGLTYAGIDVVSFANNHMANFGKEGIDETKVLLEENNILTTGIDGPIYKDIRGMVFAFLGYNDIGGSQFISGADEEKIAAEIKEAKSKADVVIVTFHWGVEYVTAPNERQRTLGKLALDSGADLIIGNHPHWIEPIEFYNGKLITYAHGNFVFDQTWSEETKIGVVGKYTFFDETLIDVEYYPIYIEGWGQPYFLDGQRRQQVIDGMEKASIELVGR